MLKYLYNVLSSSNSDRPESMYNDMLLGKGIPVSVMWCQISWSAADERASVADLAPNSTCPVLKHPFDVPVLFAVVSNDYIYPNDAEDSPG